MDIKVNQVMPQAPVTDNNQVNAPTDEAFRFTLMSAIEEEGLQERLSRCCYICGAVLCKPDMR